MARPVTAADRTAIAASLAQHYGTSNIAALSGHAPPPNFPPAPPRAPGPKPGDDVPDDPSSHGPNELATPPPVVRAFGRIGHGVTPGSPAEFKALGSTDSARYTAFVEQQLAWSSIDNSAVDARLTAAGYTTLNKTLPQLWADHIVNNGGDYNVRMRPAWESQRASFVRAIHSKRQLFERLSMFWNDHFNVQVSDYDAGPLYVHYQRDVIRANAMGNFRTMLEAVAKSTSMMYYLDNRSNTRNGPNENFARELLELHTFGVENYLGLKLPNEIPPSPDDPSFPIGYSDIDVYETARAFTGWSVNTGTGGDGTFIYNKANHDPGLKTVLGIYCQPEQGDMKDGRDVLDRAVRHPAVAKFICKKLIRHFITDLPPQSLVNSAAAVFRANVTNPDQIKLVLRHILLSREARTGWGEKRRRPFEVVVSTMRALQTTWTVQPQGQQRSDDFMYRASLTGHGVHDWPSPNGYPDVGAAWSGSNTYAMTWKMLNWLPEAADGDLLLVPVLQTTRANLPVARWTASNLVEFWCNRILGYQPSFARRKTLVAFMAQNGDAESYVITDTDNYVTTDLKRHYNQQRLRSMVSMIVMSPEMFSR